MAGFKEYLTEEGKVMLAKMVTGTKISFTRIVCGDGFLPANQELNNVTEMVSSKMELPIDAVMLSGTNNVIISTSLTNENITESFYFREKGIFISDGTKEVLGIYANNGEDAEVIEPLTSKLIKKRLKTVIQISDSDNINIELKICDYANAPYFPEVDTIEEFMQSLEAETIVKGDVIVIKGNVYRFLGGDVADINNYANFTKTEIIQGLEALIANESAGKVADALLTKKIYKNVVQLNKKTEFIKKKTVFVDENTIRVECADGRNIVTTVTEDGGELTKTYYDEEGEIIKKQIATITDEAITETQEIWKEDEDIITDETEVSLSGETLMFSNVSAVLNGNTLTII